MNRLSLAILACVSLCLAIECAAAPAGPPVVPVGYDAYRMWDHWADQRIGVRAYMRSTYDRRGGNEAADASHFLYQLRDDFNVTLDVEGPGILYFSRYNHWHGSPWHYVVDGADHVIRETATADPLHPKDGATFIPESAFPPPLAWTWATTRGADLTWVPIGFESSFQMAYERTHYGTGYYIYHQFVGGTKLSAPIRAWDIAAAPPGDVIDLIGRAGQDLLAKADSAEGKSLQERAGDVTVPAGQSATLADLTGAAGMVRSIKLSIPVASAPALSNARLRITWDNRREPSVDAPLPLFFGAGTLYNRDNQEYLVKAFPVNIRFDADRVFLSCYFPMPFMRSAKVEIINTGDSPLAVNYSLRFSSLDEPANTIGYFHATYQDHPKPARGRDMVLLDTTRAEGGGDWSGSFIGTSFIFSHNANLETLEGDPRFFFDDANTPQAQGTGTEEWGGGGDYWGGRTMTLPFAGHPTGAPQGKARSPEDAIESGYRFLLADLMPPGEWAKAMHSIGEVWSGRTDGDRTESLKKAIGSYEDALTVPAQREWSLVDRTDTLAELGDAWCALPGGDPANFKKGVAAYDAALTTCPKKESPETWAMVQICIGGAYTARSTGDPAENLEAAIAAFEAALTVYNKDNEPDVWTDARVGLSWCQFLTKDFRAALATTEAAGTGPGALGLELNRAHALLLLGRTDEAKAIYQKHAGEKFPDKSWEQAVLGDFDDMAKHGITDPEIQHVRDMLKSQKR